MANHFIKASFTLSVTAAEAEVLRRVEDALAIIEIEADLDRDEQERRYDALGGRFGTCFPKTEADVFATFRDIFSDPDHPRLGFSMSIEPTGPDGNCSVWIHGDQIDVEVAANLIQAAAPSTLPFGFEYSLDCDRLRVGEFGGGFVAIFDDGVEYGTSAQGLEEALARRARQPDRGLVIAMSSDDGGLLFWNARAGFGPLGDATFFSEAEADNYDLPIADNQPEWLSVCWRRSTERG